MKYDCKIPTNLKKTQQWFASIITRPIDLESRMNPLSPSGIAMKEEARTYIAPSPTLQPDQRIQIYNQQYWWRLLTVLQESFPLLTRLFGYSDFNQAIATPYLVKYPSNHWSLNHLGDRLIQWIEEDYHAEDKLLVLNAAKIDWAFDDIFFQRKCAPLDLKALPDGGDLTSLLNQKICLQPYIRLFEMDYDLFEFRNEMLKQDPDYWLEHDFPVLNKEGKFYFVLSRNLTNDIVFDDVSPIAFQILQLFKNGTTIDEICEWIEAQGEEVCEEATLHLQEWFQDWTLRHWLIFEGTIE